MAKTFEASSKRSRITIDVDASLHRRVREAAADRDQTIRAFVLAAIAERLYQEVVEDRHADALTATADPVLAELWDNPCDAEYDRR